MPQTKMINWKKNRARAYRFRADKEVRSSRIRDVNLRRAFKTILTRDAWVNLCSEKIRTLPYDMTVEFAGIEFVYKPGDDIDPRSILERLEARGNVIEFGIAEFLESVVETEFLRETEYDVENRGEK
jgi:hypothetical protein